jgi:monooxygenase
MVEEQIHDVIIVGAGISGIGTAYWLQQKCPNKSFLMLEARASIGGTWDLFRYPGIRSDSDMFTFGYRFKPWQDPKSLSDGASILAYLRETVEENGIDQKIRYNHKVLSADWSSPDQCWQLTVKQEDTIKTMKTRFLYMCSGYYSYDEAHRPVFEGEEHFQGPIVIPQFWPKDLDYGGKRVVIVGSGATAVTLVPAMADKTAHVTMLQRSPTYVMNLPNTNGLYIFLKKWLPDQWAYRITRIRNILLSWFMYAFSKAFPQKMKSLIMKGAAEQLPPDFEVDKHFNPKYDPWDQRLCVVPDGDLFQAISAGKASVVTETIDHFTEKGIQLHSGEHLDADIIVLATGLKMRILGGATITIDQQLVNPNDRYVYRGMLISDVPNFAVAFGYTNNPWTLKTDLTANYMCRLLNYMDRKGYSVVVAPKEQENHTEPFLNLSSGYIRRAQDILPKQGAKRPWRVYQNYLQDMLTTRFGRIEDGVLEFKR